MLKSSRLLPHILTVKLILMSTPGNDQFEQAAKE